MDTKHAARRNDAISMALCDLLNELHQAATEASIAYHCNVADDAPIDVEDTTEEALEAAELHEQTVRHCLARYVAYGADPCKTAAEYVRLNNLEDEAYACVATMMKARIDGLTGQ